jgi:hypothetical protein
VVFGTNRMWCARLPLLRAAFPGQQPDLLCGAASPPPTDWLRRTGSGSIEAFDRAFDRWRDASRIVAARFLTTPQPQAMGDTTAFPYRVCLEPSDPPRRG